MVQNDDVPLVQIVRPKGVFASANLDDLRAVHTAGEHDMQEEQTEQGEENFTQNILR